MPAEGDRYCLITGAAGGIGRALVEAFGESGYRVIATDRVDEPQDLVCEHYVQADLERFVEDEPYAELVTSEIRTLIDGGELHALVNNAAIQILGGADSLTRKDWRTTLDVNLVAPFLLTHAFLSELERAQGSVVNISSIHAKLTKANFVAYATSKAALSGMTRAMAVDLGPRVRVNAIEPAAIDTAMLREGFARSPELLDLLNACHPLARIGRPSELSGLALAIADGDLAFLHGSCVGLDGGVGARLFDPD